MFWAGSAVQIRKLARTPAPASAVVTSPASSIKMSCRFILVARWLVPTSNAIPVRSMRSGLKRFIWLAIVSVTTAFKRIMDILISVIAGKLLLPNASVAEVITYSNPEPVADAPAWLLGRVRWRGWALPIVSFSRLAGWSQEAPALGAKVAVLKAIGGHPKMPYFAVLTQGFPRLVTISESNLIEMTDDDEELPVGVHAEALFNDDPVAVPDLAAVEAQLVGALYPATA